MRIFYETRMPHTCRGTASSVATKAANPRNALFVATAVDDLPLFASTRYAKVLE